MDNCRNIKKLSAQRQRSGKRITVRFQALPDKPTILHIVYLLKEVMLVSKIKAVSCLALQYLA